VQLWNFSFSSLHPPVTSSHVGSQRLSETPPVYCFRSAFGSGPRPSIVSANIVVAIFRVKFWKFWTVNAFQTRKPIWCIRHWPRKLTDRNPWSVFFPQGADYIYTHLTQQSKFNWNPFTLFRGSNVTVTIIHRHPPIPCHITCVIDKASLNTLRNNSYLFVILSN
jgi:hypothetical protein